VSGEILISSIAAGLFNDDYCFLIEWRLQKILHFDLTRRLKILFHCLFLFEVDFSKRHTWEILACI